MTDMKQILLLAFAVSVNVFGCGCVMSHMASFYPSVAEKKGAKPSEYGLVFGIGFASAGLSSAFSGWLSKKLGPYNIILIGCTGQALASVAFGFLDYVQDKWTFLSFCYFLRALSGWSEALNCSALISVLMKIFPNESSRIIAGFQTFLGLGMAVGPFFGSLLYQWKGFSAPFWAAGCLMTLVTILMMICLPKSVLINISTAAVNTDTNNENKNKNKTNETESLTDETETKSSKELKFGDIFKSVDKLIPYLIIFTETISTGFLRAMLEPHLKKTVNATEVQVGLGYLLNGITYMITTPIIGQVCSKLPNWILHFSIIFTTGWMSDLCFFGPLPFLPIQFSLTTFYVANSILGIFGAGLTVISFVRAHSNAIKMGYSDNINTYMMVSGLWQSFSYTGEFLGSSISGVLVTSFGFAWSSLLPPGMTLICIILDSISALWPKTTSSLSSN